MVTSQTGGRLDDSLKSSRGRDWVIEQPLFEKLQKILLIFVQLIYLPSLIYFFHGPCGLFQTPNKFPHFFYKFGSGL